MRSLLTISAILELITGLALVIMPTAVVSLLLNGSLTEATGMILGRIAGVALLSLAIACWQARNDSTFSIVMIRAMLLYDIGATTLLVYAALIEKFSAIGLWPAVLLHAVLLTWCLLSLLKKVAEKNRVNHEL